jgi:sulfatase maturation enzyme AslB (radical SAM superfamily)
MMGFLDTKGVTYEITTNGSLVGIREIERLKDCVGLKSINFSLDGLREYHDNERGNGIFDKCSDAIKLSNNFLNVSISTVLKSDNLTEIPRLTRYLTSLNIKRQKIIFGMSINENIRKKTKEILPVLELQGPYFKEYLKISDSQKVKALLKIMDSFVGQNKIYITYENLKSGIQDITMEDFKYKPGVSASCRQLSGYRFNSSGQRIICEFIRNKYDLRIAAYLNNVFLPICSYCCKLDINPEGTGFGLDKIARNA